MKTLMCKLCALFVVVACFSLTTPVQAQADAKRVVVAYQTTISPWFDAVATKSFEEKTGYKIDWRKFSSGAEIITALASNSVNIGVLGSAPLAVALSRGLDIKLFWILEDIAAGEALLVRDGSNISKPMDLVGKTIAVPTASTSHFQTIFALNEWGISDKVTVVNLAPEQAAAAWQLGNVDGAFIWGPALAQIKKTGKPLITSGEICAMGRCTFEGLAVTDSFAAKHSQFLKEFVQIIDGRNRDFLERPEKWGLDSQPIRNIADFLGATPADVLDTMRQYRYPSLTEQASCEWLGCEDEGGAAKTLKYTSEFLKEYKRVDRILPNYGGTVSTLFLK